MVKAITVLFSLFLVFCLLPCFSQLLGQEQWADCSFDTVQIDKEAQKELNKLLAIQQQKGDMELLLKLSKLLTKKPILKTTLRQQIREMLTMISDRSYIKKCSYENQLKNKKLAALYISDPALLPEYSYEAISCLEIELLLKRSAAKDEEKERLKDMMTLNTIFQGKIVVVDDTNSYEIDFWNSEPINKAINLMRDGKLDNCGKNRWIVFMDRLFKGGKYFTRRGLEAKNDLNLAWLQIVKDQATVEKDETFKMKLTDLIYKWEVLK